MLMYTLVKSKNKNISIETSAQEAELRLTPDFSKLKNYSFEVAGADEELYLAWRDTTDKHLGRLAAVITTEGDIEQRLWNLQRDITLDTLRGDSGGPMSRFFFEVKGK